MRGSIPENSHDVLIGAKSTWKTLGAARTNLRGVNNAGLHAYFEQLFTETERILADNYHRGFYKHLSGTKGLNGRKASAEKSPCTKMRC